MYDSLRTIPVALLLAVCGAGVVVAVEPAVKGKPPAVVLEPIAVSADGKSFVTATTKKPFRPWGFNYDHDEKGRLIEDYWTAEFDKVSTDFAAMKSLGANAVRIHLQFGRFMDAADRPNPKSLEQLARLIRVAEETGLYLNLTGLGCYHKSDVPAWYDRLDEKQRWDAQSAFWTAVAAVGAKSPAIFCYDLMNEPVVPGGKRNGGDWLGPAFGGKHFVQFITLDSAERPRSAVAAEWVDRMVTAVRKSDHRGLVTVGLVDWSLDRKGLTSGFVPDKVAGKLDFLCVHLYPVSRKQDEALNTLRGFAVGKPVVVEECFPLKCTPAELDAFVTAAGTDSAGWFSFYWGKPIDELKKSSSIGDAILAQWLELFRKRVESSR